MCFHQEFQEGGAAQPGIHSHVQDAEGPWSGDVCGIFVELNFDAESFFSSTKNVHSPSLDQMRYAWTQGRESSGPRAGRAGHASYPRRWHCNDL